MCVCVYIYIYIYIYIYVLYILAVPLLHIQAGYGPVFTLQSCVVSFLRIHLAPFLLVFSLCSVLELD